LLELELPSSSANTIPHWTADSAIDINLHANTHQLRDAMKVNHPSLLIYPLAVIISTLAITVSSFSPPGRPHHHITPFPSRSCNIITTTNDSTTSSTSTTRLYSSTKGKNGKTKFGQRTDSTEVSRYLTEFRTADGKVVDPYKLLQVKRNCSQADIKQSYRRLSKKLHPDMVARAEILPGRW